MARGNRHRFSQTVAGENEPLTIAKPFFPVSKSHPSKNAFPSDPQSSSSGCGSQIDEEMPASVKKQGWADVARGRQIGSRSDRRVTEEELDRLKQVFSDAVVISPEKLQAARSKWKTALIGKLLGRRMNPEFLAKAILFKWKVVGDLETCEERSVISCTHVFCLM